MIKINGIVVDGVEATKYFSSVKRISKLITLTNILNKNEEEGEHNEEDKSRHARKMKIKKKNNIIIFQTSNPKQRIY